MVKKRLKLKKKNFIIFCFLILLFLVFIISLINIVLWFFDSNKTKDIVKNLDDIVEIKKIEDDGNSELFSVESVDENNPYWDYIKMNLIDVDFDELLKINEDTKGWIHVNTCAFAPNFTRFGNMMEGNAECVQSGFRTEYTRSVSRK